MTEYKSADDVLNLRDGTDAERAARLLAYVTGQLSHGEIAATVELRRSSKQGMTGDIVSFALDSKTSRAVAVVKEFSRYSVFAMECKALGLLSGWIQRWDALNVAVPRVLGSCRALLPADRARGHNLRGEKEKEASGAVMIMEVARGSSVEDLVIRAGQLRSSGEDKEALTAANAELEAALVAVARFFAALHSLPEGSGGPVPSEYLKQFVDQANNILSRMAESKEKFDSILSTCGSGLSVDKLTEAHKTLAENLLACTCAASFVHGDANAQNFFVDSGDESPSASSSSAEVKKQQSKLWLIDVETLLQSVRDDSSLVSSEVAKGKAARTVRPVGVAARDVCNFVHKLVRTGLGAGLKRGDVAQLEAVFLQPYRSAVDAKVLPAATTHYFSFRSALGDVFRGIKDGSHKSVAGDYLAEILALAFAAAPSSSGEVTGVESKS